MSRAATRRAGAAGLTAVATLVLAGCGSAADHVRDICSDVVTGTAELAPYDPAQPLTALQFARGRFALVEKAVGAARETTLPADADATLHTAWLDPAVRSMASWDTTFETLRVAVGNGDTAAVESAFTAALRLGTAGVDTAALARVGYGRCAQAFTAPTVTATERG